MSVLKHFEIGDHRKPCCARSDGSGSRGNVDINNAVLSYSSNWHLVGVFVRCVFCGEAQRASDRFRPFQHEHCCPKKTESDQFPWLQLGQLLAVIP
jgi:hypothetical protein